jgi:hypothetical protein
MWSEWDTRQLEALKRCKSLDYIRALENVAERGFIQCVRWLCETAHVSLGDSLWCAIAGNNYECARYLIEERGASVNVVRANSLMSVASSCGIEMVQLLIDAGSNEVQAHLGWVIIESTWSPRNLKQTYKAMDLARLLMKHGARLDYQLCKHINELRQNNAMPSWAEMLQTERDQKTYEKKCVPAALALAYALKRRGCCYGLKKHIVTTYVLATYKFTGWLTNKTKKK